jgi:hypothetical protein
MVVGGTMVAGPYPPLAACMLWACLILVVRTVLHVRKTELLTQGELLAIFGIWAVANMAAGRGLVHALLTSLAGPAYYARTGAAAKAAQQHLPGWLAVTDKAAVVHFFEGYGLPVPWQHWQAPLVTWAMFFIPFLVANVCLCALFETLWVRHERLAFPLVSLPLEALNVSARPEGRAYRTVLAIGFGIPILLHGFGVAHAYVPAVPCIPFYNDVSYLAASPPWTSVRPLYLNLYPLLIGITFLAPTDVTLSVWFFLLLSKLELLAASSTGWSDVASGGGAPSPPFLEEQSAGAYLALAAGLVWSARRHLRAIVRPPTSIMHASESGSQAESVQCRLPAIGFLFGVAGILTWSVWSGLPLWFAALFFGFYFAVALVLSRLMAESGIPWLLAPILPDKLILSMTGAASVSQLVLTRLTLHVQHLRDTRQMIAPAMFQAGRLRSEAGMGLRKFYALLFVAVTVSIIYGVAFALPQFYRSGALSLAPNSDGLMMTTTVIPTTAVNQLSSRLSFPTKPSLPAALAVGTGAMVTLALSALRVRCLWWPLNPLGYALTGSLQVGYANKMLLSIILGWLLKTITLRFGGAAGFRLLRGAALGLIFGDLAVGAVLKLLDALLGPSGYAIF